MKRSVRPGFGPDWPRYTNVRTQINSVSWTRTFSPTMVNEARATVSLETPTYRSIWRSRVGRADTLGINYPYLMPEGRTCPTRSRRSLTGNFYGLTGGPYPSHSTGPIYTATDSFNESIRESHSKSRILLRGSGENDDDQINVQTVPGGSSNQNGTFQFSDARTGLGATSGVSIANLAAGLGGQLHRDRTARLHHLSRANIRVVRTGLLESQQEVAPRLRHPPYDHGALVRAMEKSDLLQSSTL